MREGSVVSELPWRDGVVTLAQVAKEGFGAGTVSHWVRRGLVWRAAPAVIGRGPAPEGRAAEVPRILAHLLRRPAFHAAQDSALALHGLPLLGSAGVRLAGPTSWTRHRAGATLHPAGSVPVGVVPAGYSTAWPASSVAQAVADLARRPGVSLEEALVPLDAALHRDLVSPEQVLASAPSGVRGVGRLRQVVRWADAGAESPGETLTRMALVRAGFTVRSQVWFRLTSGDVRVDLYLPQEGVVVEFDGAVKYDGVDGRSALVREKVREDGLRALGHGIVRVVWRDVRRPDAVAELRRRVESASRRR
ncbi:hypothetical protein [Kytococcus sedentarius]|uniref:hypothetical protein n=1 Tax=Kytococcus sedentarius TaxID=1276 RepID=UPI003850F557